jgi:integrase
VAWQRRLAKSGGTKNGRPLAPNTIRLARAPLAGALRLAVSMGLLGVNPVSVVPRPRAARSVPRHWSPEQAREFLTLMEGDRTYAVWAFLLGSGLRIGELVCLRWPNVDLPRRRVHVVEFVSTLGYDLVSSAGKSRDATRSIDLDDGLVRILKAQRKLQSEERLASSSYVASDHVFTQLGGGSYHPQYLSRLLGRYTAELQLTTTALQEAVSGSSMAHRVTTVGAAVARRDGSGRRESRPDAIRKVGYPFDCPIPVGSTGAEAGPALPQVVCGATRLVPGRRGVHGLP